jgi:hypothetical protein
VERKCDIDPVDHVASYAMGTGGFPLGVKATGA